MAALDMSKCDAPFAPPVQREKIGRVWATKETRVGGSCAGSQRRRLDCHSRYVRAEPSVAIARCLPQRAGQFVQDALRFPSHRPCFALSRRMAHGSASLTVGEVGDGAAVTSGSGVRVATGLSQPAGGDDEALAGSSRGRAKGATTPVAVARSARFWSAMEGPPLMLAAPRPAGRDPGPAPPMLHKYVWLRQPPGRGWGDRARRNHRKRTAEGRRHWESAIIASGDGAFRHRTPRLLSPRR